MKRLVIWNRKEIIFQFHDINYNLLKYYLKVMVLKKPQTKLLSLLSMLSIQLTRTNTKY
jgi:hypothetical protein